MKQNSILLLGWVVVVAKGTSGEGKIDGGGGMVVCVVQVVSITGGKSHLAWLAYTMIVSCRDDDDDNDRYETVTVIISCMDIALMQVVRK